MREAMMKTAFKVFLMLWVGFCFGTGAGLAADEKEILAVPLAGIVRIDGILDEPAWQGPGRSDFVQSDPVDGSTPSERTTVWLAFDEKALYVAARLDDTQAGQVVAPLARRDNLVSYHDDLEDSDWFEFSVDPYFDRVTGFHFAVNPAGSIADATLQNDTWLDYSWDGVWGSAARIDDRGWTVEMRIPFDQLRFADRQDPVWGVNFRRTIKRKNEKDSFVWIAKEDKGYVSRFARLRGLRGIRQRLSGEFTPFVVGQAGFSPEEAGNPFADGEDFRFNAGIDAKLKLKSNLILNATVNPDFGQVEVDPAVVNLTAYETFFEEKRPFFLEGANVFSFGEGGATAYYGFNFSNPSFFYSRRIGRSPQGEAGHAGFQDYPDWSTILAAAKLSGKLGRGWNIGILNALTAREYAEIDAGGKRFNDEVEPLSDYGVLRLGREFAQGRQGVGLIATSVLRDLRSANLESILSRSALALAADGWSFLGRDKTWVVTGWLGASRVEGSPEAILALQESSQHYFQRPDATRLDYDPQATSMSGWAGRFTLNKEKGNVFFNAALAAISPGFETNDLGYMSAANKLYGHLVGGYRQFKPGKLFRSWELEAAKSLGYDFDGIRLVDGYFLFAEAELLNYWTFEAMASYTPETWLNDLTRGGPLMLHPAVRSFNLEIGSDGRKPLVLFAYGDYNRSDSGGFNWTGELELRWKPSANVSLSLGPSYFFRHSLGEWVGTVSDPLQTDTYGKRYLFATIDLRTLAISLRLNWTFSPRLSLQLYMQPYLAVGSYAGFKELARPRTFDFNFYGANGSTVAAAPGGFTIDPDGEGPAPAFTLANPDFNLKSLRGTAVLRWEYRPGATLFLVWTQNRSDSSHPGDFELGRDLRDIFSAAGENIFLLKMTYRFNL
jgi:hypothetical protein